VNIEDFSVFINLKNYGFCDIFGSILFVVVETWNKSELTNLPGGQGRLPGWGLLFPTGHCFIGYYRIPYSK